ncbi:MAG: NADPH-dependent 7-cyano-7-deazaguanine reductase QueF [Rhodocyclales bacterium]|nr:NADPH-dependent 7-cyano-7-deazaguanine reductase QueF [Rhodocyclales bacterium]
MSELWLGRQVAVPSSYDPGVLTPIARAQTRRELDPPPFTGFDEWHAYELSWLDGRGKPVAALARFRVPCDSPCLIESKSLKLYLNGLGGTRFAATEEVAATIRADLSRSAGAAVDVAITPLSARPRRAPGYPEGFCVDELPVEIETYCYDSSVLYIAEAGPVEQRLVSHLLKSNCPVTGQPDWGCVVVHALGPRIDPASFLRYVVSFRQQQEFHEQCVERIYRDLWRLGMQELMVLACYTRRGGLDISPVRASCVGWLPRAVPEEIRQ